MAIGWKWKATDCAGSRRLPSSIQGGGLIVIEVGGFGAITDGTGIRIIRGGGRHSTTAAGAVIPGLAGFGFPAQCGDRPG